MCVNARNHPLIPMNSFFRLRRHSRHELILGKSNLDWLFVQFHPTCSPFDRSVASDHSYWKSWSLRIHSSSYSDASIIWCLCVLSSSGWVPILTSDSLRSTRSFGRLLSDWSYMASSMCQLNSWWWIPSLPFVNVGCPRWHPSPSLGRIYT